MSTSAPTKLPRERGKAANRRVQSSGGPRRCRYHWPMPTKIQRQLAANPQILVVCTGNICRSPIGEVVLRNRIEGAGLAYGVASCGVSDEERGNPIYPPAARVLREAGYPVPVRSAHRATRRELAESGLILAMTTGHARALRRMCADAGVDAARIHLWREFDGDGPGVAPDGCFGPGGALADGKEPRGRSEFYYSSGRWDVADPWGGGPEEYDRTLAQVEAGAEGLIAELTRG